jgi:hypothetical protein
MDIHHILSLSLLRTHAKKEGLGVAKNKGGRDQTNRIGNARGFNPRAVPVDLA